MFTLISHKDIVPFLNSISLLAFYSGFGEALMNKHIAVMQELVRRDKNRPSVIMWSVGNEPKSNEEAAGDYFRWV